MAGASPVPRGTATPVAEVFAPAEAEVAALRVESAIAARRAELDKLRSFAADNSALRYLVRRLPDQISHHIMVPFGSAAFFPGRLIHTNEFLVLLGEGYYAERSAKQTEEILERRGSSLHSQIESLSAVIADLELEAKFFKSTAAEAAEGLIEIKEEYVEEHSKEVVISGTAPSSADGNVVMSDDEKEHARIMERLAELEKEEEEEGSNYGDEDEENVRSENNDDSYEVVCSSSEDDVSGNESAAYLPSSSVPTEQQYIVGEKPSINHSSQGEAMTSSRQSESLESTSQYPEKKANYLRDSDENWGVPLTSPNLLAIHQNSFSKVEEISTSTSLQSSRVIKSGSQKAFTGSVVERVGNLQPPRSASTTEYEKTSTSKPVSRFKMQRGGN